MTLDLTPAPALARIPTISIRDFATIRALLRGQEPLSSGDAHVWIDLCINSGEDDQDRADSG